MTINSEPSLSLLADTAAAAARAAGAILLEELGRERHIEYKGIINLVTDADRRAEQTVVSILRARFPDHQILAEEGSIGGSSNEFRWIVDPLDGTTNYAHGYPHFAVSIALERRGEIVAGAVLDPVLDELFTAQAGAGAYLNGRSLAVSSTEQVLHGLLSTGFPYDRSLLQSTLSRWERFVRRAQGVRRDGSAALDICYVAAGRFDGFWEDHLFPWDMAAALLMVRESRGMATDFHGNAPDVYKGDLVVSNGLIHQEMLAILAEG